MKLGHNLYFILLACILSSALLLVVFSSLPLPAMVDGADDGANGGMDDGINAQEAAPDGSSGSGATPTGSIGSQRAAVTGMIASFSEASNFDVILDISPETSEYIEGAVHINYEDFLDDDNALKPVSELARLLGDAGISSDDSVLIYGECQPCGGGPSAATYAYWVMKYLGHEDVKLLDGGIADWVGANGSISGTPATRPDTVYSPTPRTDLLATYDYVNSGEAQIVDARSVESYAVSSIPGAVNIPYESVLNDSSVKDPASLAAIFAGLSKDKPVVVYTDASIKASAVWFGLQMLGYDSRIYTYRDWNEHVPKLNVRLKEIRADPNPARTGDAVRITAVFEEGAPDGSDESEEVAPGDAAEFIADAAVTNETGYTVASIRMTGVQDAEFSSIWNADVPEGQYNVSVRGYVGGIYRVFLDALSVEIL